MKKKNLITTVASVAMVGVIAVGSTLAYLTANDGKLTNTFDFVDNGIAIDLWETDGGDQVVGKDEQGSGNLAYTNVVAGQVLTKEVHTDVNTSVDTWVFVKIDQTGAGANVTINDLAEGWVKVAETDNVYARKITVGDNLGTDTEYPFTVFTKVTVPADITEANKDLNPMVLSTAAIQAEGFATAELAYAKISSQL